MLVPAPMFGTVVHVPQMCVCRLKKKKEHNHNVYDMPDFEHTIAQLTMHTCTDCQFE
jgi:hypothetical protein